MLTTLTPAQMKALEADFMAQTGVPGSVLMEMAAHAVMEAVARHAPSGSRVLFLCGPGNNGGAPGRTHQKPVIAAHKQFVEPGAAGFPAVRACVQGQLALILGLGLPGRRLETVAAEQGYGIRREQVPVHPAIAGKV